MNLRVFKKIFHRLPWKTASFQSPQQNSEPLVSVQLKSLLEFQYGPSGRRGWLDHNFVRACDISKQRPSSSRHPITKRNFRSILLIFLSLLGSVMRRRAFPRVVRCGGTLSTRWRCPRVFSQGGSRTLVKTDAKLNPLSPPPLFLFPSLKERRFRPEETLLLLFFFLWTIVRVVQVFFPHLYVCPRPLFFGEFYTFSMNSWDFHCCLFGRWSEFPGLLCYVVMDLFVRGSGWYWDLLRFLYDFHEMMMCRFLKHPYNIWLTQRILFLFFSFFIKNKLLSLDYFLFPNSACRI